MIRITNVLHGADKHAEVPPCKGENGNGRAGPADTCSRRPRVPKQSNGKTQAANHGRVETLFRKRFEMGVQRQLLAVDEDVAEDNGQEADETPSRNGQEHQPGRLEAEVVHEAKCVGHAGEEAEEDTKVDRHIETQEGDDGLGEEHVKGANDGHTGKQRESGPQGNLGRQLQALSFGEPAFDNGVECLADKRQLEHAEDGEEDERPLRPPPVSSTNEE
ncbi:hypothetical protein J3458_004315 [Metarhizium acridum]|uniref:uncharacterized protein n=1 Tax=Metarhizium acridum TaxID=92637 RepID=UPI001C6D1477|nr:hypothetical protein J3458_004315 [Metarhizium acridum]